MAGNSGGPWGGGGGNGRDSGKEGGRKQPTGGKNKPEGNNPVPPEIDDMLKKGQEQLLLAQLAKARSLNPLPQFQHICQKTIPPIFHSFELDTNY